MLGRVFILASLTIAVCGQSADVPAAAVSGELPKDVEDIVMTSADAADLLSIIDFEAQGGKLDAESVDEISQVVKLSAQMEDNQDGDEEKGWEVQQEEDGAAAAQQKATTPTPTPQRCTSSGFTSTRKNINIRVITTVNPSTTITYILCSNRTLGDNWIYKKSISFHNLPECQWRISSCTSAQVTGKILTIFQQSITLSNALEPSSHMLLCPTPAASCMRVSMFPSVNVDSGQFFERASQTLPYQRGNLINSFLSTTVGRLFPAGYSNPYYAKADGSLLSANIGSPTATFSLCDVSENAQLCTYT